jgi:hypothetical protein
MAVAAADGKVLWRTELQDEFARCPVVGPGHVVFGFRGGTLAVLNRADGKLLWSRRVPSRFYHEPLLFDDGRFVYFSGGTAMVANVADGQETPLQWWGRGYQQPADGWNKFEPGEPMMSLTWYQGRLIVIARDDHEGLQMNYAWHPAGGRFYVLSPAPEEKPKP